MQDPVKVNIFQSGWLKHWPHRNPVTTYCQGPFFFKLGWLGCCCGSSQPASGWFHSISQRTRLNQHCRWLTAGQRFIGSCPEGGHAFTQSDMLLNVSRSILTLHSRVAPEWATWVVCFQRAWCPCAYIMKPSLPTTEPWIETQVTVPLQRLNINFKRGLKTLAELKNPL